jgi:adenine-specific DNA-methyltransferase
LRVPPRLDSLAFRRRLRRTSTEAEQALWHRLRGRRLGVKFRRQFTVGPYTLDFFCPARRLAIELDGGVHYLEQGRVRDEARDTFLAARGIRVVRFSDWDLLLDGEAVLEAIWREIQDQRSSPSPRPSPPRLRRGGEGGR